MCFVRVGDVRMGDMEALRCDGFSPTKSLGFFFFSPFDCFFVIFFFDGDEERLSGDDRLVGDFDKRFFGGGGDVGDEERLDRLAGDFDRRSLGGAVRSIGDLDRFLPLDVFFAFLRGDEV